MNMVPSYDGLCVSQCERKNGGFFFAEVAPAPRWNWRPWRGRTSRWWYEIHSTDSNDAYQTTHAYSEGGSGGAFTLRRCIVRASEAVDDFLTADLHGLSEPSRRTA